MISNTQNVLEGTPASSKTKQLFSDGQNQIVSIQLSLEYFLANEDSRMQALIELYQNHCSDGQIPTANAIPPEKIAQTKMMSRTHCLRVGEAADDFRYSVWAQDATFDGFRSLQNAEVEKLSLFKTYGVLFEAVKHQLAVTVRTCQPTYFEVKGEANDHYYYFTKAILPLRGEQGEIVKCLVPFTDKLPDIPADLRHKFLSIDIDQ